ncbi:MULTISPECIES: hypothetical protein [Streptomyces]|uniref:Uncharacterized protein n=1 Tax=Streptomyces luteosporeus TaxID=173856 RepID=A0ABP6GER2_9ACTN
MDSSTLQQIIKGLSPRMLEELHRLAARGQGTSGLGNLRMGGGTEGALYRRGLIGKGVDGRGWTGYFLSPRGWSVLHYLNGTVRPADPGRLDLETALAEAYAPYRVLIADSDEWDRHTGHQSEADRTLVHTTLDRILAELETGRTMTVVHNAEGPAKRAYYWVQRARIDGHPVHQELHLDRDELESVVNTGADICLVFTHDGGGRIAELAKAAGITVRHASQV